MSTSGPGSLSSLSSIVNQDNKYINGMRLTYATTTTFVVGAGLARDSNDVADMIMGATLLPTTSAGVNSFVSTSEAVTVSVSRKGAAGIDVGTVAASTLYSVFAIGDSRGFSMGSAVMSLGAPTFGPRLPSGYDVWRYIGSIRTTAGSLVTPFIQTGAQALRTMWYDSGSLSTTTVGLAIPSSATTASQNSLATIGVLTTLVPQAAVEVMVYTTLLANAAGDSVYLTPYGFTAAATGFAAAAAASTKNLLRVPCAFNAAGTPIVEIDYATSSATATVGFTLPGYVDQL